MVHLRLRGRAVAGAAGLALFAAGAVPAGALAAGRPIVTTGGPANVTQTTATLTGRVRPNGAATTYYFQYGAPRVYGAATAVTGVSRKTTVAVPIAGLAPFTTYHYRLVAHNRHGTRLGADRTFKTKRQPLGVSLIGNPNPVAFGKPTTLQGILSGTNSAGRQVVLQSNPFPYTQGFVSVTNPQVTNAQGQFFFPLVSLGSNTQFRVVMTDRPDVVSPVVTVFTTVRVSTHVTRRHTSRGLIARFHGSVTPATDPARFGIQRFTKGQWRTVTGGVTRHRSASSSSYSKRVRIRHSGSYRVFVEIRDGQYASNTGRTVHIRR